MDEESSPETGFQIRKDHKDFLKEQMRQINEAKKTCKLIDLQHNDVRPATTRMVNYAMHAAGLVSGATIARMREEPRDDVLQALQKFTVIRMGRYSSNDAVRTETEARGDKLTDKQEAAFADEVRTWFSITKVRDAIHNNPEKTDLLCTVYANVKRQAVYGEKRAPREHGAKIIVTLDANGEVVSKKTDTAAYAINEIMEKTVDGFCMELAVSYTHLTLPTILRV